MREWGQLCQGYNEKYNNETVDHTHKCLRWVIAGACEKGWKTK